MDDRVEGLDPAAQHLRCPGEVGHLGEGDAGVGQRRRGAAAGHQLPPELRQPAGELLQTGLVVDGQQCLHSVTSRGDPRPITGGGRQPVDEGADGGGVERALHRLDALVQAVHRVVGQHRDLLLGQDGAGVHLQGGHVHGGAGHRHPGGQRLLHRVPSGEGGQEGGVGVQDPPRDRRRGPAGRGRCRSRPSPPRRCPGPPGRRPPPTRRWPGRSRHRTPRSPPGRPGQWRSTPRRPPRAPGRVGRPAPRPPGGRRRGWPRGWCRCPTPARAMLTLEGLSGVPPETTAARYQRGVRGPVGERPPTEKWRGVTEGGPPYRTGESGRRPTGLPPAGLSVPGSPSPGPLPASTPSAPISEFLKQKLEESSDDHARWVQPSPTWRAGRRRPRLSPRANGSRPRRRWSGRGGRRRRTPRRRSRPPTARAPPPPACGPPWRRWPR